MPIRITTLSMALLLGACLPATAASGLYAEKDLALARQAMATAQTSDLAWELVASLTTEVGPRPAGSPNDAKAVAWAKAKLESLGFDRVWTEPVKVDAWIRGNASASVVAPYPQTLAVAALGNSVSTPAGGITAEVAYYETFEQLKNDTSDRARGRIVFIDSMFTKSRDGRGYGQAVAARGLGAVEAGKRGAVAVLIRSIGTDRDRLPHTGSMRYDEKSAPPIPAAAVSVPDAQLIRRQVDSGKPVKISLSMQNSTVKAVESHNVLAEIRGTDKDRSKAEQVVLIGGHLDSWDLGTGAIDDGAGVAIAVAAAKILKDQGVKPRRTIRVVLFANEENGLDGGRGYAAQHGAEKHQLAGESDLGAGAVFALNSNVDEGSYPWIREIAAVLAPLGVELGVNNTGAFGADIGPLIAKGHAAVALAQDASEYFDYHHTANDTLDKVNPVTLRQNVAAWAALVWLAAQAERDFGPGAKRTR